MIQVAPSHRTRHVATTRQPRQATPRSSTNSRPHQPSSAQGAARALKSTCSQSTLPLLQTKSTTVCRVSSNLNPPRGVQVAVPPPPLDREVPDCDTDPLETAKLWKTVRQRCPHIPARAAMSPRRTFDKPTEASKGKLKDTSGLTPGTNRDPVEGASYSSGPQSSAGQTASISTRTTAIRITEPTFRQTVLPAYKISISTRARHQHGDHDGHFRSMMPKPALVEAREWYHEQVKNNLHSPAIDLPKSAVWLSMGDQDIDDCATEYKAMMAAAENEAKYSYVGKKVFFKVDPTPHLFSSARQSTTYFVLEWGPTPDGALLRTPPLLDQGRAFGFNTNPDCTYWLTTQRLRINQRSTAQGCIHTIRNGLAMAPYLTIEFKKDDHKSLDAAQNQVACSGTLHLYNRFLLRCQKLSIGPNRAPSDVDFEDVRHYGITSTQSSFSIFSLQPVLRALPQDKHFNEADLVASWDGCHMQCLATFNVAYPDLIPDLCTWINEIHLFGLTKHSRGVISDLQRIIGHPQKARLSLDGYDDAEDGGDE